MRLLFTTLFPLIMFTLFCQLALGNEILFREGRVYQDTSAMQQLILYRAASPASVLTELVEFKEFEILFKPSVLQHSDIFTRTRIELEDSWKNAFNILLEKYYLNADLAFVTWPDGKVIQTVVISSNEYARLLHRAHSETPPFRYVIKKRDLQGLKTILEHGVDPNIKLTAHTIDFSLPLLNAVHAGWVEGVDLLLENGANPNVMEARTGMSALVIAAWLEHDKVLEILLKKGADPNLRSEAYFLTPLDEATWRGTEKAVRLLLEHRADPNQSQLLPSYAVRRSPSVLALLIQHGLDPSKLSHYTSTDPRKREIVSQAQQKKGTGKCFEWQANYSAEVVAFVASLNTRYLEQLSASTAKPVCMMWVQKDALHLENPANFGTDDKQAIIDEYQAGIKAIVDGENTVFAQIVLHFPKLIIHTLDKPAVLGIRLISITEIDTREHAQK